MTPRGGLKTPEVKAFRGLACTYHLRISIPVMIPILSMILSFVSRVGSLAVWVTAIILVSLSPAYAYLDPGTGSIIIQSMIAAAAAGFYIIKIYWYRLKAFFGFNKETETAESVEATNEEQSKVDDN